ncbi:acyl-CoA thioesterase [Rossellomorea vietnamensis]|uniref:acyl-CoA thioesterase n=1 Tax=Rossellomorea vietnamensis TaxID=218284 RepID=UPI001E613258|nr:thioesterase family protein [Rossellomorea vietnamensis]MCC5800746.1 acyl-CoA thioesterase [Rossellomorea vietnamensis]
MDSINVRSRFCETDALGHINNTTYFVYLEEARIKFFQTIGFDMDVKDWQFILASTKCDFLSQGYFNQELVITTDVSKIGSKSFQLDHDILCAETHQLIARGNAVIVYFDFQEQRSKAIPDLLKAQLNNHFRSEKN